MLVDVRRQLADAVDDRAATGHLAHQEAARVANGLGGDMLEGDRALLDPVHVHAGLVGEGLAPDERHVVGQDDVGHLGHAPHGGGQHRQAWAGDAGVAQLELQVADQARQVGVAAPLAETGQRALDMRSAGLDRGQRVGDAEPGVVMGVDADHRPSGQALHNGRRAARDLPRKAAAVRLAEADDIRAGLRRRGHRLQRVVGRRLPAVEEMLGVEDDALALSRQPRDRVADDAQVLGERGAQHLRDVQVPGLAEDHDHPGAGLQQALEVGVVRGRQFRTAGRAEGGDPGLLERLGGHGLEEGQVLGIGAGVARLDQGDAQVVERLDDHQLVVDREGDALGLRPVAQGRIQQFQTFHRVVSNLHRLKQ